VLQSINCLGVIFVVNPKVLCVVACNRSLELVITKVLCVVAYNITSKLLWCFHHGHYNGDHVLQLIIEHYSCCGAITMVITIIIYSSLCVTNVCR
jgi:hypothetical protein